MFFFEWTDAFLLAEESQGGGGCCNSVLESLLLLVVRNQELKSHWDPEGLLPDTGSFSSWGLSSGASRHPGRSQNSSFSPAALLSRLADSHSPYQLCPDSVLTCACQPSARPLIPRPFPWCPGIGLWPVFFLLNGCLGFTPFLGSPRSCLISSCDDILL